MSKPGAGLLERTGIHMTQEDGEKMKKTNDEAAAVLASISSSTTENEAEVRKIIKSFGM